MNKEKNESLRIPPHWLNCPRKGLVIAEPDSLKTSESNSQSGGLEICHKRKREFNKNPTFMEAVPRVKRIATQEICHWKSSKNTFFEKVIEAYQNQNFQLTEFFHSQPPKTPIKDSIIMQSFDLDALRDSVLYNICRQDLPLEQETIKNLLHFLSGDFIELTNKIYIQVFLHFTKMDVNLMYKSKLNNFSTGSKVTLEEYFNRKINSFVTLAAYKYDQNRAIETVDETIEKFLKVALVSKPIKSALCDALCHVLGQNDILDQTLHDEIKNMKIYSVCTFNPFHGLRGACVLNGIFICTDSLANSGASSSALYKADLLTIAVHECCHYLTRVLTNNFNFSSPYQCKSKLGLPETPSKMDPVLNVPLEMGRYVELLLFDNIQPNWFESSPRAAQELLDHLQTYSKYPLISKDEHGALSLKPRLFPSHPFGIDIDDDQIIFF